MCTKKILINPHGRETIVLMSKDVPNGKLSLRLSSNYHDYIVVDLSVRFCKAQDFHDIPDELLGEVFFQTYIDSMLMYDDSII